MHTTASGGDKDDALGGIRRGQAGRGGTGVATKASAVAASAAAAIRTDVRITIRPMGTEAAGDKCDFLTMLSAHGPLFL